MAKATYAFEFNFTKKYVYFFAYSGEPEKTLRFFWNMHHHSWLKINWADAFVKANPEDIDIEVSFDRDDVEYRYEINWDGKVRAQRKHYKGDWHTFFIGHYSDFIRKYDEYNEYSSFYQIGDELGSIYLTYYEIENHLSELKSYDESPWRDAEIAKWEKELKHIDSM